MAECRRLLTTDGRVVVRGFVPGHTELAWLDLFPGREKAVARFPSLDALTAQPDVVEHFALSLLVFGLG